MLRPIYIYAEHRYTCTLCCAGVVGVCTVYSASIDAQRVGGEDCVCSEWVESTECAPGG